MVARYVTVQENINVELNMDYGPQATPSGDIESLNDGMNRPRGKRAKYTNTLMAN